MHSTPTPAFLRISARLCLNHRSVFADSFFTQPFLLFVSSSSVFPPAGAPPLYFWLPRADICGGGYGWLCYLWRAMCHQIDFHLSERPWNVSGEYRWMDGWELEVWWENPSNRTQKSQGSLACDGLPNENRIQLMGSYEASSFIVMVILLVFFKWNSAMIYNIYWLKP